MKSPIFPLTGKVYVASSGTNREAARELAARLVEAGHRCVSSWHENAPFDSVNDRLLSKATQLTIAATCLAEIRQADVLVVIGHPGGRGHLVEYGFALGLGLPVVWLGERLTCFASLAIDGARLGEKPEVQL